MPAPGWQHGAGDTTWHGVRGRATTALLLPAAFAVVFAADVAWPFLRGLGAAVTRWPPLARLQEQAGRLPVAVALPLFLIPELCSRLGWVVSVWLVLHGQAWRGLAVYAGTKAIAGTLALWICAACLPVLLRVRAFAATHGAVLTARRWVAGRVRARAAGPLATAVARQRAARRLRARNSAAAPGTAIPSAPVDPSRTG